MTEATWPTAEAAEVAFYQALEAADLEAMMAVWDASEEIVCIHPLGPRLSGRQQVRESWQRIFASGPRLRFRLSECRILDAGEVQTRVVFENITVAGAEQQPNQPVIATNIYRKTARGWRMLLHHASPGPATPTRVRAPSVLH